MSNKLSYEELYTYKNPQSLNRKISHTPSLAFRKSKKFNPPKSPKKTNKLNNPNDFGPLPKVSCSLSFFKNFSLTSLRVLGTTIQAETKKVPTKSSLSISLKKKAQNIKKCLHCVMPSLPSKKLFLIPTTPQAPIKSLALLARPIQTPKPSFHNRPIRISLPTTPSLKSPEKSVITSSNSIFQSSISHTPKTSTRYVHQSLSNRIPRKFIDEALEVTIDELNSWQEI